MSCIGKTPTVALHRLFPQRDHEVLAKLEFLNPGGSVKDRPASYIVGLGLRDGTFRNGTHLVESSSGNFGIALAMAARLHDLRFTCVVDPNIAETNLKILRLYGAEIDMVRHLDEGGGYLQSRIARVKELLAGDPTAVWVNQYANDRNWEAHYHGTGAEIVEDVPGRIDYLVLAVSTTGTIRGTARRVREAHPGVKVIAVDAVGSVIFVARPGPRRIPGIGASRPPELLRREEIDQIIFADDAAAVRGCRDLLAAEGIFAGGSSGFAVAAIRKLLPDVPAGSRIVTLFPDRGERYLDSVYDDAWCDKLAAARPELAGAAR